MGGEDILRKTLRKILGESALLDKRHCVAQFGPGVR